jgi:5-amino-6-(5-phospho-D-ribitylamino)uracil phosphatase
MPRYRLLAIDIDGTLVNSQHELSERTRQAVLRAKRAGVEIVLATGRRYSRVLPLVEPLELNVPLITASGAIIKRASDHQTLFQAEFLPRALEICLETIAAHNYEAVLYGDTFHEGFDFYHRDAPTSCRLLSEFFAKNEGFGRALASIMSQPPPGIFAGFVMGSREQMYSLIDEIERALPGQLYLHVLRSPRYAGFMCEIAPAGVSKWTGVWRLAEEWGIAAEEICAVGDDVNDIPMIEAAGLGVAMGNAVEETKAAADRIALTNDEDGLEQVVDWVLE